MSVARTGFIVAIALSAIGTGEAYAQTPFHLLEATIPDVHRAIQEGQVTCRGLVQAYLNRARAYNGTCNTLVTEENVTRFLPNYAEYKAAVQATLTRPDNDPAKTPPIEFGRMEPTASDPSVQQQFGMGGARGRPRGARLQTLAPGRRRPHRARRGRNRSAGARLCDRGCGRLSARA